MFTNVYRTSTSLLFINLVVIVVVEIGFYFRTTKRSMKVQTIPTWGPKETNFLLHRIYAFFIFYF